MATTPNFLITHWANGQSTPEVTVNSALDDLEAGVSSSIVEDFATDGNHTPVAATVRKAFHIHCTSTGSQTAKHDLILPDEPHLWLIVNATTGGQAIRVIGTGTGIDIATAKSAQIYSDGTNMVRACADF